MSTALSKHGEKRLVQLEGVIERGLNTFLNVGKALMEIRDGKLYRAEHESFELYCRDRWRFSSRRANQLMDAAEIGTMVPIENERQARALAPLKDDPGAVRAAYDAAEATGIVTAASLAEAVAAAQIEDEPPEGVDENGELSPSGDTAAAPSDDGADGDTGPGEEATHDSPKPSAPEVDPALRFRKRISDEVVKTRMGLLHLDPEDIAELVDGEHMESMRECVASVNRWWESVMEALDRQHSVRHLEAVR